MSRQIQVEQGHRGDYQVTAAGRDGDVTFSLFLTDVESISKGRLDVSAATARATAEFLLQQQDAVDLPPIVDIGDVAAGYSDAMAAITSRRHPTPAAAAGPRADTRQPSTALQRMPRHRKEYP